MRSTPTETQSMSARTGVNLRILQTSQIESIFLLADNGIPSPATNRPPILAAWFLPSRFSCWSRLLGGLKFPDHGLTESLHLFHLWTELQKQEVDSSAFKLFDLLLHLRRSSHQP